MPRAGSLLPWLVGAQALGVLLADRGDLPVAVSLWLGVHALGLAVAAAGWPRGRLLAALVIALCSGAVSLGLRVQTARRERPAQPLEVTVSARLGRLRATSWGWSVELRDVRPVLREPTRVPSRLLVRGDLREWPPIRRSLPGAGVRARLRIRPVSGLHNPGGSDVRRRLERSGIGALGSLVHPRLSHEVHAADGPRAWLECRRRQGAARLRGQGRGGGLLAALAFGDRSGLAADDVRDFSRLGLSHLLAVSGLHLGLVAASTFAVARLVLLRLTPLRIAPADPRRPALAFSLTAAAVYALLTGFDVPVRRALVLLLAFAASVARRRPAPRGQPLWLAAGVILAVEPAALFRPGAQLSFLAAAGLLGMRPGPPAAREDPGRARRLLRAADGLLRTSAAAAAATAPVAAIHFGTASPLGWLTNLAAVPLTAALLLPAALVAAVGVVVWPEARGTAAIVAASTEAAVRLLDAAGLAAAATPAAEGLAPARWAFGLAAVLAVAALRARTTAARALLAGGVSGLLALAPPATVAPAPPRAVFLDVGLGDATLVQGRAGALLVDAGRALPGGFDAGRSAVVPALRALGVRRLDVAVASHADLDHRGGLVAVLESVPTRRLWLPPGGTREPAFARLLSTARRRGVSVEERGRTDAPERIGDLEVEVLSPPRPVPRDWSDNDASLVLRVAAGRGAGRRVLLAGDLQASGEADLLSNGIPLAAEVLKLSHHGSVTSSSRPFLDAVRPELAVASAPRFGRLELPHGSVLRRLGDAGIPLLWTGRDGAVLVGLGSRGCVRLWSEPAGGARIPCADRRRDGRAVHRRGCPPQGARRPRRQAA